MALTKNFFKVADPAFARITEATKALEENNAQNEHFLARATKQFGEPTELKISTPTVALQENNLA